MFNVDTLQGIMTNNDLMSAQFDLINEACIFMNTQQMITKINSSAQMMFNMPSEKAIGLQLSEYIGTKNNHLL